MPNPRYPVYLPGGPQLQPENHFPPLPISFKAPEEHKYPTSDTMRPWNVSYWHNLGAKSGMITTPCSRILLIHSAPEVGALISGFKFFRAAVIRRSTTSYSSWVGAGVG